MKCTLCGQRKATTRWGAPVCQPCYDGLEATQSDLEAMEADDPTLKAAGERVEQAVRKYLGGT